MVRPWGPSPVLEINREQVFFFFPVLAMLGKHCTMELPSQLWWLFSFSLFTMLTVEDWEIQEGKVRKTFCILWPLRWGTLGSHYYMSTPPFPCISHGQDPSAAGPPSPVGCFRQPLSLGGPFFTSPLGSLAGDCGGEGLSGSQRGSVPPHSSLGSHTCHELCQTVHSSKRT
jgi:hypothetical protein